MAQTKKQASRNFLENFCRVTVKNKQNRFFFGILNINTGSLVVFNNKEMNAQEILDRKDAEKNFTIEHHYWYI